MKTLKVIALALTACVAGSMQAADFFSTEMPETVFNIGVRVGVNTSNRNIQKDTYNLWNVNSWGTGFDAGVVADINFRDYISVQPGFFYESRSGKYTYSEIYNSATSNEPQSLTQFGSLRTYNFTIPILASVHFNLTDNVRWNVDFGPYFNFRLGSHGDNMVVYNSVAANSDKVLAKPKAFDFGFKMGTGLQILKHYYVGVHYTGGCLDVWKDSSLGGRNKAWVFSVGYDF